MSDQPELTEVRSGHRFDEAALEAYMHQHVEGYQGPLTLRQFEGGQSNPTFLLQSPSGDYVLRKQPPGELLPSAHQVNREYRVMQALAQSDVPVPEMHALCEDPAVIGTKFYIMQKVPGRVFTEALLPNLRPEERRAIYRDLARVLAALHSVDYTAVGLGDFGKPGNYYARQISRWSKQYLASKTEELESMENLIRWLPEHLPEADETVIVHGDYRLGNVLIHPTRPEISAVLDWELSTLGHPLADLGYICQDYHTSSYNSEGLGRSDISDFGIPTEQEFINDYLSFSGRPSIENWNFYIIYNLFRSAAIVQGVYKRGLDGNASSAMALEYGEICKVRAELAWELAQAF